jgi:hypothetical protein
MLPMAIRLGVFVLLISDYWGDPGLALSPLARPFCSTPTTCPCLIGRSQLQRAMRMPRQTPAPPPWKAVAEASALASRCSTVLSHCPYREIALPASPPLSRLQP